MGLEPSARQRKRPPRRLPPRPAAMVRSADIELVATTLSKNRRSQPSAYTPSPSPPSRSRGGTSRRSTVPSAEGGRSRASLSSPLPMELDSDLERDGDRSPTDPDELEVTRVSHPPKPIQPFPGFRRGNLLRVRMQNFLTFTDTIISPGPRMNLILGPNGTGKSTICNAVCIVFGGNPKLLGRTTDLGSFVKHGENKAIVEAIVYDPSVRGGVVSVKRVFDSDGKGQFYLDGVRARASDISSKVNGKLDIQLDNLSQFMPQERITEFTNLKPDELLSITVRSLGGTEKENLLQNLTKLDDDVGKYSQRLQQTEAQLAEHVAVHEAEAEEVEAFRQQQEAKKRLKLYKKYLPHLQAKALKAEYIQVLHERKALEDEMKELKDGMAAANSGPINACQQAVDAATESCKAAKDGSKTAEMRASTLIGEVDDAIMRLSEKSKQMQDAEATAERRRKGIELAEMKLAQEERDLAEGNDDTKEHEEEAEISELEGQRNRIRTEINSETTRKGPLEQQRQNSARAIRHFNQKLNGIGDVRQQRIRELAHRLRSSYLVQCDQLVHEMRSRQVFRGEVCGPVAAEIEVDNKYYGRIMEASVSGFLMTAFVTESARDSRLLLDACREKFSGWAPDIITAPTTKEDELDIYAIQSQVPTRPVDDRLRSLGIERMVNDVYNCPKPVRAALNAQAGLHDIYVGNERSDACKEELRREDGVQAWFTPTARCQVVRSRYDRSVRNLRVETQFASRSGAMFSGSVHRSEQERERLVGLIREEEGRLGYAGQEMKEIEGRVASLTDSLRKTETDVRAIMSRRKERRRRRERVNLARQHLESLRQRAAATDVRRQKESLKKDIRSLEDEAAGSIPGVTQGLRKLRACMVQLDEQLAKRADADRRLNAEKSKNSAMMDVIKEKEVEFEDAKRLSKKAKADMKAKQADAAKSLSNGELAENEELFTQLEEHDVDWLEKEIARQSGRVQGLATDGQHTIDRYEHRQRKIDKLTEELAVERSQHQAKLEQLKTQKNDFLTWLQTGIEKMRAKFSRLYRRLGCAGDLELVNKDSDRIGDLQLQILVSYRDDAELRPISPSANSGGEKMCCTMLFCFSLLLEEERIPPFVFVDELNQGLDPSNEMKIMTMMFEDAEKDVAPQSFVITPKLLLNLPFHDRTKTHIIFNGSVTGKMDIAAPYLAQ